MWETFTRRGDHYSMDTTKHIELIYNTDKDITNLKCKTFPYVNVLKVYK